jgi:predicted glycosyltransferase
VKDHQAAKAILGRHFADLPIEEVEEGIQIIMRVEQIPVVNELLVMHGIAVYGIIPIAKTLEEKFLVITESDYVGGL